MGIHRGAAAATNSVSAGRATDARRRGEDKENRGREENYGELGVPQQSRGGEARARRGVEQEGRQKRLRESENRARREGRGRRGCRKKRRRSLRAHRERPYREARA